MTHQRRRKNTPQAPRPRSGVPRTQAGLGNAELQQRLLAQREPTGPAHEEAEGVAARGPAAVWTTGRAGGHGPVTSRPLSPGTGPSDWLTHHSDRSNSWAANNIRNARNPDLQAWDFTFEEVDERGNAVAGSAQGLELIVPADSRVVGIQKTYRGSGNYGMFIALEDVETGLRTSIHHLDSVGDFRVGQVLKGGTVFGTQGGSGERRHQYDTHVDIIGSPEAVQSFVSSNQSGTFRTRN